LSKVLEVEVTPRAAAQIERAARCLLERSFARSLNPVARKSQITLQIDSEVLEWFRGLAVGYNQAMVRSYTAKYTRIDSGYMGQLVEWPEVVTEGGDIEDCRSMLRDALREMVLAYQELGKEIPQATDLFEQVSVELGNVRQTA
jgi:predicted RNase H-like HicB family nuclease